SNADRGKVGGDARPAPAGGARRTTPRIIWIASDTECGTEISGREFTHRRLADDDGSRLLHLRCDCGIPARNEILEDYRPVRRGHVAGFDLILEKNRNAMQRTPPPGRRKSRIQSLCLLKRARVNRLNGVQPRPFLVVRLDTLDVEVDEFPARDPLG